MTAYVLIQKRPDAKPVGSALRAMPAVISADDLTGPYDAIAVARASSSRDLFQRVLPEIRELPGVTHALPAPLEHVGDEAEGRAA
jgi:DNA-binding Lrp family transcriptional regulator